MELEGYSSGIRKFYDANSVRETHRTQRSIYHRIEFGVVQELLRFYLPERCRILDVGCGGGNHSIPLARKGHSLGLVEISENLLRTAKARIASENLEGLVLETYLGDVRNYRLSVPREYDAVLAFGPMYHSYSLNDRKKILCVLRGALDKDGLIFAIFITRFALLKDLVKSGSIEDIGRYLDGGYLESGIFGSTSQDEEYMPLSYGAHRMEVYELFDACNFTIIDVVSCESIFAFMAPYVDHLTSTAALEESLVKVAIRLGREPALVDSGDHFLVIARAN